MVSLYCVIRSTTIIGCAANSLRPLIMVVTALQVPMLQFNNRLGTTSFRVGVERSLELKRKPFIVVNGSSNKLASDEIKLPATEKY